MRKVLWLLFVAALFLNGKAQKVIENPYYEVKKGGIEYITKIELGKKETKVTLRTLFMPNWWIKISDSTYLEIPETEEKFYVKSVEGTDFNKETFMTASGDSTFVLTFPPLGKKVSAINYYSNPKNVIYGLSLDKKHPERIPETELPAAIKQWFEKEAADALIKEPLSPESLLSEKFFYEAPARLVGYFKRYDRRLGFETGRILYKDVIRDKSLPVVVSIQADGRFEAMIDLAHPEYLNFFINNQFVPFYIEPGQTLAMVLDWEEFLVADRIRDGSYYLKETEYYGPLAETNRALTLANASVPTPYSNFVYNEGMKLSPEDFEKEMRSQYKSCREDWEKYLSGHPIEPKAQAIKEINMDYEFASFMYQYSMRKEASEEYKDNFPIRFYRFLTEMPLDNQLSFLARNYGTVLNRFEFMPVFKVPLILKRLKTMPEKTIKEYFTEIGEPILEGEGELLDALYGLWVYSEWPDSYDSEGNQEKMGIFYNKKKEILISYSDNYLLHLEKYLDHSALLDLHKRKDLILENALGLTSSLTYEIVKMRALSRELKRLKGDKEEAICFLNEFTEKLTTPYFKTISKRVFSEVFPSEEKTSYVLPEGDKGAELFRSIIDPYKGKILFVDFWATTCAPCIAGIKQTQSIREKYRAHPEVDFVFITDDAATPSEAYQEFVEKHSMYNSHYLKEDAMNYIRKLFKFTAIPRYIKVGKDGSILDDDYRMWYLEQDLKKTGEKKTDSLAE